MCAVGAGGLAETLPVIGDPFCPTRRRELFAGLRPASAKARGLEIIVTSETLATEEN
jgi:hypothetical protein